MSKPQVASEPSMEEILASIRKMISDDRPGPNPMPDQMGRTPFGEPVKSVSEYSGRAAPAESGSTRPAGPQPSNFNSLADALKVATALSDQRRSLQQEIATALEKGPRGTVIDPLGFTTGSQSTPAAARGEGVRLPEGSASPAPAGNEPQLPSFPGWNNQSAKPARDDNQELLSFDFGTVVPQQETSLKAAPATGEAKPSADKPDSKSAPASSEDSRVVNMPSRGAAPTAASSTVAPFPRPARDAAKPGSDTAQADKAPEQAASSVGSTTATPAASTKEEKASAEAEALLDAVVDMVQQQPDSLSVFTSGASFIGGIAGKKHSELVAAATAAKEKAVATAAPGAAPKLDGAAAELLRPMLRQWLADNMPRIVEDALRSEITSGDKGPGKS
jgi:cell pole-organizing protein PopZ